MRKHCKVIIFLSVLFFSGYLAADDCKKPHGFSINAAGDQVWFAPGNLQYQASTNTWRFAERQFDRCGDGKADNTTVYYTDKDGNRKLCNNQDVSATYEGWIDIFCFGTSGYNGANPWNKYGADVDSFSVNSGDNQNYDWGLYNEIYEGTKKHPKGTWRTPTQAEWDYIMDTRKVNGGDGYSCVSLQYNPPSDYGLRGIILYPDDFSFTQAGIAPIASSPSYLTTISLSTWEALERVGCVFLPFVCCRRASDGVYPYVGVNDIWDAPWGSTPFKGTKAGLLFEVSSGYAVRLISNVLTSTTIACGETYIWDLGYKKVPITASGDYSDTLRGVGGCDSIISHLHLLRRNSSLTKRDTVVRILQGETFTWDLGYKKLTFDKNGEYYDTLKNACGWDSVCSRLRLKVIDPCASEHPFTINADGGKVIISPGNLQYCATQDKWRFAERQFDRCGNGEIDGSYTENHNAATTVYWKDNGTLTPCNNYLASSTYGGWIDLFSWGSSGVNGAFPPYYGYSQDFWSDWGQNTVDDDPANTWRTLTKDEWEYLFVTRKVNNDYGFSQICLQYGDKPTEKLWGGIIYPDDFSFEKAGVEPIAVGLRDEEYSTIEIDISIWNKLEAVGCVFLPSGKGADWGGSASNWYYADNQGMYWTSTLAEDWTEELGYGTIRHISIYCMDLYPYNMYYTITSEDPSAQFYVRLVKDFIEGDASSSETQIGSDIIDTLRCGNTYIWDLGYKLREITQTETEKEYTDELEADCGKLVSKLKLVLKPLVADTNKIAETICAGEKYTWDLGYETREVERENDYYDTLRSVQGCDSVISILHLTVKRPIDDDYSGVIHCGETYEWDYGYGKEDITEPGVHTREKIDEATGCVDTISTLHLMFSADDVEMSEKEDVIYEGEKYTWKLSDNREREFDTEGDYYDTIREGTCDKLIAHLKLVLTEKPEADPCDEVQHPFSINANGGKVLLAPGNLQYQATTKRWRFAERQFDRIGDGTEEWCTVFWDNNGTMERCNNLLASETYGGWISVFGWGTSGHGKQVGDKYACQFAPYSVETPSVNASYNDNGYGPSYDPNNDGSARVWGPGALNNSFDTLSGTNRHFDWGYDNEIWEGNIMHKPNTWRTLTSDEWTYMIQERTVNGKTYPFSVVRLQYGNNEKDTVTGILLYPDDFTFAKAGVDAILLGQESVENITSINLTIWEKLNQVGVIFLPNEPEVITNDIVEQCRVSLWAASSYDAWNAGDISFEVDDWNAGSYYSFYLDFLGHGSGRSNRQAVRLARDVYGTTSGTYRKQVKETKDTLRCGNDYTWVLEDGRTIPINQTEREKEHFDTVIVGCDSIISHLKLVVDPLKVDEREKFETIEQGETYQWKITETKTREITTGGTYRDTVRSVGGCDSIISILTLTVTSTEPYDEPVYDTICNKNDYEWIRERTKIKDITQTTEKGTYRDTIHKINGKDSIYCILYLTRLETKTKPTNVSVCIGKRYDWYTTDRLAPHLSILVEGDYTNSQTIPFKNYSGCDSVVYTLNITAKNCHDCVPLKKLKPIPPKDVCADSVSFNYMFQYVAGHPSTYSVKFDAKAIADGFVNIEGNFEPENIFDTLAILPVNIPQKEPYIRPWSYKVHLNITDTCGKEYKFTDSLHVFYPSKIIDQHWNDVLALFNSRYNGGYEFSAYQWYIDNSPIYGATRDHYYFPANLSETSKYRALLTRSDDGYTTFTCPVNVVSVEDKNLLDEPYIYVHPTFVPKEEPIIQIVSNLEGNFWIYDMAGKMVSLGEFRSYDMKKGATLVRLPSVQSAYLVYLIPKDKKHIKDKSYIVIVR